jgi:hypothetical protein
MQRGEQMTSCSYYVSRHANVRRPFDVISVCDQALPIGAGCGVCGREILPPCQVASGTSLPFGDWVRPCCPEIEVGTLGMDSVDDASVRVTGLCRMLDWDPTCADRITLRCLRQEPDRGAQWSPSSFAYSALASLSRGMSGSASFQRVRKSL